MKKIFSLFAAVLMAVSAMAYTLPTGTIDLATVTDETLGTWVDAKSCTLGEQYFVASGYALYKSTANQTWITQTSVGSSGSSWTAQDPFLGSSAYTSANYATIQSGRNLVMRVKNCTEVKVYGKNNSASRYLVINIYEVNNGAASSSAAFSLSNTETAEQVWSQAVDGSKEYVVDIEGVGSSNSRVFEVAFKRNVAVDTRLDPQLSVSATQCVASAGDAEFTEPVVSSAAGYTGSYTYTTSDASVAEVNASTGEVTIGVAGKATITIKSIADATYKQGTISYTITVNKVRPVGYTFYESFDSVEGTGGNDGQWSGSVASGTLDLAACDNEGWLTTGDVYAANQCVRVGKSSSATAVGGFVTPALGVAGDGKIQFEAESWGSDGSNFFVVIEGAGTFVADENLPVENISSSGDTAKVAMNKKGQWKMFTLNFTGVTAETKLHLYAPLNKRAFIDEVAIWVSAPAPVVTPVVLTGAVTAEAINITTESTGTWYGNILSEYYYGQYKGSMTDSVIVQALADQNLESADELYTGSKSFTIAELTINDAALTPGKYYFIAGGLVVDEDPSSMYGYANNGEPIVVEFTVADPVLSFTFAPGEDGVITVTPNMNDKHYVVIFCNEDLLETMSAYEPCTEESLIANYVASLNYLDEPESVVLSGVNDVDINEFAASQYEVLYVALSSGTYSMIVVEVENNGRYWTLAEGSGRYEGVSYTFALPDFVGTVVLGETGISVTGIEEDEDLYVCYMLDKATYDEFSAAYSDDDLMNMTLGSSLPDETFALYHTLGDVVLYADQDYFVDPELGGAGEYVVLVANVDMMTGKIGSHAVSYPVTLDAEGKKSTTTAIDNVEAAKVAKTIENGQVVIIREGVRYNAVGAKL